MKATMLLIHDVATQAGVSVHTLRYYERAGLLPRAERTSAGYRVYSAGSVRRVRLVRMLRSLGFTIGELKGLGGVEDFRVPPASVRKRLRAKRDEVGARLREYERAWKLLDALQGCRCRGDCVLVTRLLDAADQPPAGAPGKSRSRRMRSKAMEGGR